MPHGLGLGTMETALKMKARRLWSGEAIQVGVRVNEHTRARYILACRSGEDISGERAGTVPHGAVRTVMA